MEPQPVETVLNWTAGISVVGTLIGWLPSIAAAFGIIWYAIQIYDRFYGKRGN